MDNVNEFRVIQLKDRLIRCEAMLVNVFAVQRAIDQTVDELIKMMHTFESEEILIEGEDLSKLFVYIINAREGATQFSAKTQSVRSATLQEAAVIAQEEDTGVPDNVIEYLGFYGCTECDRAFWHSPTCPIYAETGKFEVERNEPRNDDED